MTTFSQNLLNALEKSAISQKDLAQKTNITPATISRYINGQRNPSAYNVKKIAEVLNIGVDELLDEHDTNMQAITIQNKSFKPQLTSKDEKDIAKKLEEIINDMNSSDGLMLYNNDLDDETKELLIASLERTLRQAKLIAKEKFTPHKHRK